jgi:hypothetical protein
VSLAALRWDRIDCRRRRRRRGNLGALRVRRGGVGVASSGLRRRQVNGRGDCDVLRRLGARSRRRGLGWGNGDVASRARGRDGVRGALGRDRVVLRRAWWDRVAGGRLWRRRRVVARARRRVRVRAALRARSAARLGYVVRAAGLGDVVTRRYNGRDVVA